MKEAAVAYLKVITRHSPEEIDETGEKEVSLVDNTAKIGNVACCSETRVTRVTKVTKVLTDSITSP
jgi:hypothetical protein